ncbi:MAG: DUF4314 domain-containing protein [Eubacteriales bacterium]|nr:DUF4314 domain-containing protein [Eubacteriales bacterium]
MMDLYKKSLRIKAMYPPGTKVELIHMDEDGMTPGLKGIVDIVDDIGTVHCTWENGRKLGIVPGVDSFTKLSDAEISSNVEPDDEIDLEP